MHQIDRLVEVAERLGCDTSDVIRASLDLLAAPEDSELRSRAYAALERNRRVLESIDSYLIKLVLEGWAGNEMLLRMEHARVPQVVRLLDATVKMIRRLHPYSATHRSRIQAMPTTPFHDARDELLTLLSSPAVRVLTCVKNKADLPLNIAVAASICNPVAEGANAPVIAERQYARPAEALQALASEERIQDVTREFLGPLAEAFTFHVFRLEWSRCRRC
jgi:hypothetical protein